MKGKNMKNLLTDKKGMGTIEIVIIIAVLIALAIIFKNDIIKLFNWFFQL